MDNPSFLERSGATWLVATVLAIVASGALLAWVSTAAAPPGALAAKSVSRAGTLGTPSPAPILVVEETPAPETAVPGPQAGRTLHPDSSLRARSVKGKTNAAGEATDAGRTAVVLPDPNAKIRAPEPVAPDISLPGRD